MTQLPGWSRPSSPFHAGEQLVQRRLGVRERMETVGRRVLRNFMPDQHREFFAGLPFLVLAAIDGEGQPWAAAVTGAPGFLSTPDDMTLRVAAEAPADLAAGADIGAVGIDFAARRRNRANGVVAGIGEGSFDIAVRQSFGNCPKYIQARHWTMLGAGEHSPGRVVRQRGLGATERTLIAAADTFFIASALGSVRDRPSQGADASHRGGPPGFVRVDDERTLAVPDFTGNSYFNTLGNLALNPRCGLLFIDFATGTTLAIAAEAEIIWEGAEVRRFAGAQRVIRFRLGDCATLPAALPLRWRFGDFSPFLAQLGGWDAASGAASPP